MKEIVAGVDIGGTNTVFGLVDRTGTIVASGCLVTTDFPDLNEYVKALSNGIKDLVKHTPEVKLTAVGIGAPDANYYKGTIEHATNLVWKGIVPLVELVQSKVGVPVKITNDANAAALGEMIFGAARGMRDFIVLTLGTGTGSGIVVNGQVVYGYSSFAGELGHITVVPGGRDCGCGKKGCVEAYASATGIVRTALELMANTMDESTLRDIAPSRLTSKMIAEAAAKKDTIAVKAMEYTAEKLGFCITSAITFSSPEAIFLFGGLAQAGEMLFAPVRKYVDENVMPLFRGSYKILPSGVPENNAAVLGAAALAWNEVK